MNESDRPKDEIKSSDERGPSTGNGDEESDLPEPEKVANPSEADADRPAKMFSITHTLESLVKLVGVAGGVAAVMGVPAVGLQFLRLGIPMSYLQYDTVLSAGVVPAVLVLGGLSMFRIILQQHRGQSTDGAGVMKGVLYTLTICAWAPLVVGVLAAFVLAGWGLAWLLSRPLTLMGWLPANRDLLVYGGGTILLIILVIMIAVVITSIRSPRGLRPENAEQAEKIIDLPWPGFLMVFLLPAYCVALLAALKGVVYLWDPNLSSMSMFRWGFLIWVGVGGGLTYLLTLVALISEQIGPEKKRARQRWLWLAGICTFVSVTFFVLMYTIEIYPQISQGWGGGKPMDITLCVEQGSIPPIDELSRRLPHSSVSVQGTLVCVDSVQSFRIGDSSILLLDSNGDRGVAVSASDIRMTAWER